MKKRMESPQCETCGARENSILCDLSHAGVLKIDGTKNTNSYKRGQIIFYEGNRPSGLFCVFKGKVKIYKSSESGREHIVRLAKNGDVLGYRSLLSGELYSATAEALEETTVCHIPYASFMQILAEDHQLMNRLMQLLTHDLREAEERMVELSQLPVRERLAQTLLMLSSTFGTKDDGATLDIQLTREDLANIVGTATESCIRLLSEFRKERLVTLSGKNIVIADKPALIRLANIVD